MKLFIVGSGRCGSTALMRMLSCHPDLFVANETHWITKLYEIYGLGTGHPQDMLAIIDEFHHVDGNPTTLIPDGLRQSIISFKQDLSVRQFTNTVFEWFASVDGKSLWADKTPDYCGQLHALQLLWPEAKFIHLIRNGLHVAQSMAKHPGYKVLIQEKEVFWTSVGYRFNKPWLSDVEIAEEAFLELWSKRVLRTRDEASRLIDNAYMEVRYEDLIADAASALREISAFSNLPLKNAFWIESAAKLVNPSQRTLKGRSDSGCIALNGSSSSLLSDLGYIEA